MDGESSAHGRVHSALAETYPRPRGWAVQSLWQPRGAVNYLKPPTLQSSVRATAAGARGRSAVRLP